MLFMMGWSFAFLLSLVTLTEIKCSFDLVFNFSYLLSTLNLVEYADEFLELLSVGFGESANLL